LTLIPRVVMFSRIIPGCNSIRSSVSLSMRSTYRRLPLLACAQPSSPEFSTARISAISSIGTRRPPARKRCSTFAIVQSPAACTRPARAAISLR
jgi:hypothetical protein